MDAFISPSLIEISKMCSESLIFKNPQIFEHLRKRSDVRSGEDVFRNKTRVQNSRKHYFIWY